MKNFHILILIALFLVACGGGGTADAIIEKGDVQAIKQYRSELMSQRQALNTQLEKIDAAIANLESDNKRKLISAISTKTENFEHFIELQGSVSTKQLLTLTPEFSGILKAVYVKEGQGVAKGQVLAKIDDGGLAQQLAQVKIQAQLAKTTFERQQRLWKEKIGSEMQYLQAKSNFEAQNEMVSQLQSQLAKTTIKAPFSGTIDEVITDPGTTVAAGQSPIIRIVNLRNMFIETDVPESYIPQVTKGKKVLVEFPVLGTSVVSKVQQAGSYINPDNRTFRVQVPLANKDKNIKPNLTAKLKVNDYTNTNAILLPMDVISENAAGQQYVYLVADANEKEGKAERRIITTGKTQGDRIEILSGLEAGVLVIKEGARSVKEGEMVQINN